MDKAPDPIVGEQAATEGPSDSVLTQPGADEGNLLCLQCQAPLRAPRYRGRPVKFCRGSKCRSAWHLDQQRKLIDEVEARLSGIRTQADELEALIRRLKR